MSVRRATSTSLLTLLAVAVAVSQSARAEEPQAEQRVRLRVAPPDPRAFYVGEEVPVALRIGYDAEWLLAHGTSLFHQPMDLPLQVEVPWLRAIDGARVVRALDWQTAAAPRSLVLNDAIVALRPLPYGEKTPGVYYSAFLGKTYVVRLERPGTVHLERATLTFAWAERFEESLLQGRVPVAVRRERIEGPRHSLTVLPLPEEGRPAGFSGAVGRYTLEASVDRSAVDMGEVFRLTVTLRGDGDLDSPTLPRLDGIAGLHVYGALATRAADARSVTYEVAVVPPGAREIPALSFAFFDPTPPAAYRAVTTAPIPLQVRAPLAPPASERVAPTPATTWLVPALLGAVLVALLVLVWLRRGRRSIAPSPGRLLAAALAHLRACAAQGGAPAADALADVLAAHLGCRREAVLAPDLAPRLCAARIPEPLAARTADILERLVAERYGAPAQASTTPAALEALASDLTRALDEPG